jgi:hypothetical protein
MNRELLKPGFITGDHSTRRVFIDGKELLPKNSLKVRNHSPSGFEWGYGGSGPAQLALEILLELVDRKTAEFLYQDFKRAFIAPADDRLYINIEDVKTWIAKETLAARLDR